MIWKDGHETRTSLILKQHSDDEYTEQSEEQQEAQNNISTLKSELEDLLADEPEVDNRVRDLHKLAVNIRSAVKEDSKTYKIADKLAAMCREETVNFDSDILPSLNKVVSVMDLDLQNNDILRNPNMTIAYDIKNIEIKFL